MYKTDNRRKKNRGKYTALGIVLGIALAVGGMYVYDNYRQPILKDVSIVKQIAVDNMPKAQPDTTITPIRIAPAKKQLTDDDIAHQIHNIINVERTARGLDPLGWDDRLASIAKSHSEDMVKNYYFDHISPDGQTPQDRLGNNGYVCSGWSGENIQQNYKSTPDLGNSITQTWMQSQGHRDNILSPNYKDEGIGVFSNSDVILITEDFC